MPREISLYQMLIKKFSKRQISRQFMETVISSTKIEGIHLTKKDLRSTLCQEK